MNEEQATKAAIVIVGAVAYAVSGYFKKVRTEPDVAFDSVKFGTTVLIGLIAGGVMLVQNIEDVGAAVTIAIPIADQIVNTYLDIDTDTPDPVGGRQ